MFNITETSTIHQKVSNRKIFKTITRIIIICLVIGAIYLFIVAVYGIWRCFDKQRMHRPYTYKLGKEDPEYVTFEHLGNDKYGVSKYKVSFHKNEDNPESDYVIISTIERIYPPLQWCYLKSEGNILCIEDNELAWFSIDTIVSQKYEIHVASGLWSWSEHLTPQEIEKEQRLYDSLEYYPFRMWVYPEDFNQIGYTQSPYRKLRDNDNRMGRVVRVGK